MTEMTSRGAQLKPELPCAQEASHLPCSFGCNALILIHSGEINICDANFSGNLDPELERNTEENQQVNW